MSLQHAAKYLAQHGRGKDTMLVHMTPREVGGLQALAKAGGGSLSVNPNTGLPEAGFLDSLLPMIIGGGLMAATGGASAAFTPGMIGLGVGAIEGLRTGNLGKGITAGLGAYGGAGLGAGLMGVGESALASQNAGAAFNPATMATVGDGALPSATAPQVLSMEQMGVDPSATFADLDKAQQAQKAAVDSWEAQQNAMRSAPQAIEAPASSALDKIKAGLGATTDNLSSAGNFLKDNAKYAMAAASPLAMGMGQIKPPTTASSGPNPYRYRFERGEASPFPTASRTGVERSYFPNMRYVPYAGGGAVEAMSDANAIGANTGFPMADIQRGAYATPYQQPISQNVVTGDQDTRTDPYTGVERFDDGGLAEQNPLLESPYAATQEVDNREPGGGVSAGPNASAPGQGVSGLAASIGLGLMGLSDALGPFGIVGPVSGMIGNAIAGQQANAMGEAQSALGDVAAMGEAAPGIVSMSDSQGNVVSVSTPASITAADVAMGLADAVAAADSSAPSTSSAGVSGGTGSGSDGGTGDAGTATDGGASAASGEANGGLLRRKYAMGGLSDLGGYSDGGRLLRGPGDGVSDSIPAVIGKRQPARLADGEFVVPARIVSELGNGSTEAGARKLYAMLDRVQKARGKTVGKGKVAKNTRADKYLPA